jgi:GNAT superfamily N-acetyltransferase
MATEPERWTVGEATPADFGALVELMTASPLLRRYGVSGESARASLDDARRAGDLLLVCRRAGRPAGLAWAMRTRILGGGGYLRLLLVAEDRQGHGIGGRLLRAVEARARTWGDQLYLLATTDNDGARRFYERRGYRHVGVLPGLVVPGIDEALYHKPLRPIRERDPERRSALG